MKLPWELEAKQRTNEGKDVRLSAGGKTGTLKK